METIKKEIIENIELEKNKDDYTLHKYFISIRLKTLYDKKKKTDKDNPKVINKKYKNIFQLINLKKAVLENKTIYGPISHRLHKVYFEKDNDDNESNEIKKIRKLFKDKTIAFVGMGSNIKDKGLGKEIDSHDIVYRTNMYPLPEILHRDYGKRCDVIAIQGAYRSHIQEYIDANVKLIIYNQIYINEIEGCMYLYTSSEVKNLIKNYIREILNLDPGFPTAGLVAYIYSVIFEAKSFKYYGITGYQDKNKQIINHDGENNYIKEYQDFWGIRKPVIYKTNMKTGTTHNFAVQNKYLSLALKNGLLDMDEYSKPYFQ